METRKNRCSSSGNNINGGLNTAIIEEDKNRLSTMMPRQDLYTTAFVTPLKSLKKNGLPWPFTALHESLQEAKILRSINETGLAVSGVCMAAIIIGSLTENTLLGFLLICQSFAIKLIPYSFIISLFFWTGALLRKLKWILSWKLIVLLCFAVELLSELGMRYLSSKAAHLVGLVTTGLLILTLMYNKTENATSSTLALIAITRFVAFGFFLPYIGHAGDHPIIFMYFACFFGLSLGYLMNASKSGLLNDATDSNDGLFTNKIPIIRKRRGSSVDSSVSGVSSFSAAAASRRRTSMPLLGIPNRNCRLNPRNHPHSASMPASRRVSLTSVDLTTLGEAHGMIADLLADSSLPQSVTGALKVISDMLSPLLQQSFQRTSFSSSLVTVLEKTQVHVDEASVKDQPDLKDDTPLSLKNRLSRQLGVGVRRMSSSYTTTTSATGMPSLDIDYRRGGAAANANHTEERRSRTPSPSPKANRAKSYAGIYNRPEIRREFMKSRSFCQPSPPDARKNSLLKDQQDNEPDSIFKTELAFAETNFIDDNIVDDIEDDDEIFEKESPEQFSEQSSISNNSELADKPPEIYQGDSPEPQLLSNEIQLNCNDSNCLSPTSVPKRSVLASRKVENLNVAQVAPVRKNSRDESAIRLGSRDGHGSRRGSGIASTVVSPGELQHELVVAASCEIHEKMDLIATWEFPIFELSEKCHILTQVAYRVFQNHGFFHKFKIPQEIFFRYFRMLESGYHDIPYHNQIHAADVLQGTYYFTNHRIPGLAVPMDCGSRRGSLDNEKVMKMADPSDNEDVYGSLAELIPDLELMALYTASAMHDFDHPGRTNAFLVATLNPKALLYNDRSVLENHHAAAAWALLLSDPANNFLCGLDSFDLKRFRFIVVEEILSTDLKKHFDFLTEWNAKVSQDQGGGLNWSNEADRLLVGQMCIKLSDISGPTKTWDLHYKWTKRIVEEFYLQGDAEAMQGMPISPYMDRNQPRLPHLQDSFIKHLVGPLYNAYGRAGLLPGEWVESEMDNDDDNEDEDGFEGSSQSFTNDSQSERSEDESDVRVVSDQNGKQIEIKKRKVTFCETTNNINQNIERWQQIISAEAVSQNAKGSEDNVSEDIAEDDKHKTIDEEEENDSVSNADRE